MVSGSRHWGEDWLQPAGCARSPVASGSGGIFWISWKKSNGLRETLLFPPAVFTVLSENNRGEKLLRCHCSQERLLPFSRQIIEAQVQAHGRSLAAFQTQCAHPPAFRWYFSSVARLSSTDTSSGVQTSRWLSGSVGCGDEPPRQNSSFARTLR